MKYNFDIVDDFFIYMQMLFLKQKDDTFETFKKLFKNVLNEKNSNIIVVRIGHGEDSKISLSNFFLDENDISHNFSCPKTPQQNGVVER